MLKLSLKRYLLPLLLASSLLLAATAACNGGSSPAAKSPAPQGSPAPLGSATPQRSPASSPGASPQASLSPTVTAVNPGLNAIEVVAGYLADEGVGGHKLDTNATAECTFEVGGGTPINESQLALGQFCVTLEEGGVSKSVYVVELPDSGEKWRLTLEMNSDDSKWKVTNVEKATG